MALLRPEFVDRYASDPTRPTFGSAAKDLATRSLPWAGLLWVAIIAVGFLITGPLNSIPGEDGINRWLQTYRGPTIDRVTQFFSTLGNTEYAIGICLVVVLLVWWRTKQWWYAVLPGIAMSLQATIFVIATAVAGRQRPDEGPGLERMDPAPPTSSYPSGHVGAAFALYYTLALMARQIENVVLRRVVTAVLLVIPFLVFFARVFRGMHHLTDCIVGMINGLVCVYLAWRYLRRDEQGTARSDPSTAASAAA